MIRAVPYTSLWFGVIIWTLVTGALLIGTSWWLHQNYLFAYHSKAAMGIVERKFMRVSHGRHGDNYTPCLDYRYQTERMAADCDSAVQGDTYSAVSVGDSIPILYLPEEFTDNRINLPAENQKVRLITFGLIAASLVIAVGGAFTLRYYVRQNKTNRYLLANGLSCQGAVTDVNYDLIGKARTKRYYLIFKFRDNQGRERTGRGWYLKPGDENLWKENSLIHVYFDSNNSESFTVDLDSGPSPG
ncbi:MAG TPA: DUF3592 domain-containing protein [Candidatus Methylacidiphilales bacterium]|jgi:hypothetical protein|nr:DUF3592 domain-containing protein [Candidatus Methylacidiphilales bacterium]